MQHHIAQSEHRILRTQRNTLLYVSMGLLFICLLQSIAVLRKDVRVVVTPPTVPHAYWLNDHQVSPSYLALMSRFYASLRFDKTPTNAIAQSQAFLEVVTSNHYNRLKEQLVMEDHKLQQDHITTAFYPIEEAIDIKKLRVDLIGDFHAKVGDVSLPVKRVTYRIDYRYQHGKLLIKAFYVLKKNDKAISSIKVGEGS